MPLSESTPTKFTSTTPTLSTRSILTQQGNATNTNGLLEQDTLVQSHPICSDIIADVGTDLGSVLLARAHDTHRMRRAALNPYFSKASVNKLETINREKVSILLERFEIHRVTGKLVSLSIILRALTSDIINQYAFGNSGNNLDCDDYNASFYESIAAFFEVAPAAMHCGWLGPLLNSLPISLMSKLSPAMGTLHQMRKVRHSIIDCMPLIQVFSLGKPRSTRSAFP